MPVSVAYVQRAILESMGMKILMVSEDVPHPYLGGLGKHAVVLANALTEAGHQVDFMGSTSHPFDSGAQDTYLKARFIPGLYMSHTNWKEKQLGFFNPWKRPFIARRMARAILAVADEYDVVHYHGHVPILGAYLPASLNFVQTRHDQGGDCLIHVRFHNGEVCTATDARVCAACIHERPSPLRTVLSARAVAEFRAKTVEAYTRHKVIYVSDMLKRNFARVADLSNGRKEYVVHNFVDYVRLRKLAQGVVPPLDKKRTVFIAARLDVTKGVGAFLGVMGGRVPEGMRIRIAGEGLDGPRLRRDCSIPGVEFLGWQSYEQTVRLTVEADLVVVPSLYEEPCATTVLEALALGKRCLTLACGGTPELKRYERYPEQLALYPDMKSLVAGLQGGGESTDNGVPDQFIGDVQYAMAYIVNIYNS